MDDDGWIKCRGTDLPSAEMDRMRLISEWRPAYGRVAPYGVPLEIEVPPGPDICVSTEWEIRAETYALFERGGVPWPNRDWEVEVDTFCFYKN